LDWTRPSRRVTAWRKDRDRDIGIKSTVQLIITSIGLQDEHSYSSATEEYNNFSIVNMVLKLSMPLPSPDYFRLQDVSGLTRG
jgi:hypothetical protein